MLYATVRQRKIHVKNPVTVIQNGIGVDWLVLDMDDEWREMNSIVCVFTNGETAREMLHTFGQPVRVPWECLTETGLLSVSCTGYVGSEKVMTTMMPDSFWNVVQNGPVTGDTPMEPTPTLYEQVLAAAGAANSAATQAAEVSAQLMQDKENGVFNGADGVTPTVRVGTVLTGASGGEAQVSQTGTATDVVLNFVIPRGLQGIPGGQGVPGRDGVDGYSPTVSVSEITGGHRITITDRNNTQIVDVMDGKTGHTGPEGKQGEPFTYEDFTPQQLEELRGPAGHDGLNGKDGKDGATVQSFERTSGNGSPGTTDTYTLTMTDGSSFEVFVYNGADGEGSGDMTSTVYDPQGKKQDIFRYVDDKMKDIDPDVTADEVTFADGETFQQKYDSGELTGKDGEPGETGPAGRGVQSMTYDSSTNKWTISYTDGTTSTVDGPSGGSSGGSEEIFVATYGTTTCAELEAAWQAGKVIFVSYDNACFPLTHRYGAKSFYFYCFRGTYSEMVYCSYDNWRVYEHNLLPYEEEVEYSFDQYAYKLGQPVMTSDWTPSDLSCLRNSKLVSSEEYPTNNGEIFWLYE